MAKTRRISKEDRMKNRPNAESLLRLERQRLAHTQTHKHIHFFVRVHARPLFITAIFFFSCHCQAHQTHYLPGRYICRIKQNEHNQTPFMAVASNYIRMIIKIVCLTHWKRLHLCVWYFYDWHDELSSKTYPHATLCTYVWLYDCVSMFLLFFCIRLEEF